MWKLWLIQLFWLALALPGHALLRRWDPESLRRGLLFALARCYLASFMLLTPAAVLGYWLHWPLWSLSGICAAGISVGAVALVRDRGALRAPNALAAVSCALICFDLWLGLRAGAHTQGDAGYHIARVRMLIAEGLSNWDPIVAEPRLDIIYHTNLYHALIAVSGQLTGSDAAVAWLATWPFAKLLMAAGVGQLACCVFGSAAAGWLASLAVLASQVAYSALPFPNTLAPVALLPMGLCAAAELWSGPQRAPRAAAWLAASAIALAQMHALNAIFLAMVVGPVLLALLVVRAVLTMQRRAPLRAGPSARVLLLGMLACGASLPWLVVAGAPRMQVLFELALPTLKTAAPLPQPRDRKAGTPREDTDPTQPQATAPPQRAAAEPRAQPADARDPKQRQAAGPQDPPAEVSHPQAQPAPETGPEQTAVGEVAPVAPTKVVYKAERFRKLSNGMSVYEPGKLRGAYNANLITLVVVLISLALGARRQFGALALFVAMTCAWLLVPALCSVLLFVTGAPWAALRIAQVLPVAFYALVPAAPLLWLSRVRWLAALAPDEVSRPSRTDAKSTRETAVPSSDALAAHGPRAARASLAKALVPLPLAAAALLLGSAQISHGEPWTPARLWEHALDFEARTQWENIAARQALLCGPIPSGETVMAHPRWDYGLPMHCRSFVIALAPDRGWHGLAFMNDRRADVDEFFHERTNGPRRLELMRKYRARYVYTSQRIARRILRSLPKTSRILAEGRPGAVVVIDTKEARE